MLKIYFTSDSRYQVDRQFVIQYLTKIWQQRGLPSGALSVAFVGSRKAKQLAKTYLKDDQAHPVLTFPYLVQTKSFPTEIENDLLGEIIICYPQVSLHAASQDKEINTIISQFLDHAAAIMANEMRKKTS
jgi:rRNA maturation RNase YbeY